MLTTSQSNSVNSSQLLCATERIIFIIAKLILQVLDQLLLLMTGGSSSVRGKRKIHEFGAACGGRKASSADKDRSNAGTAATTGTVLTTQMNTNVRVARLHYIFVNYSFTLVQTESLRYAEQKGPALQKNRTYSVPQLNLFFLVDDYTPRLLKVPIRVFFQLRSTNLQSISFSYKKWSPYLSDFVSVLTRCK